MKVVSLSLLFSMTVSVQGFCPVQPSRSSFLTSFSVSQEFQDEPLIREEVSRRVALVMAAATVAAGTSLPAAEAMSLSMMVESLEFENLSTVNTNGAPEKHLPQTTVKGTSVEVVVPHVMDPEKPHYIQYVWLKDEAANKVVAAKKFEATDASPPSLLANNVKAGTTVKPLLFCNLHGLWQGDAIKV